MASKPKSLLPCLLFLTVFLLSTHLVLSSEREDPELRQCKQQCRQQPHDDPSMQRQCERRCEERQREKEHGEQGRDNNHHDPEQMLQQCRQQCEERHRGEQQRRSDCEQRCEEKYREMRERRGHGNSQGEHESQGGEEENNPYLFTGERFRQTIKSQHGYEKVLQRFNQRSDLLLGIANYRLAVCEADPHTFVIPKHKDADAIYYVVRGQGVMKLVYGHESRESHDIRQGDIIMVKAGTIIYMINKDSNEKLHLAKLMQPVSTPGRFENFFDGGGENPESYFRSFSSEVLEAAFNAKREQIEKVFGKQSKGVIFRAPEEKIRALSRRSSEGGRWPWGGESQKPFNLLNKRPVSANERGQLYEADGRDYQELTDIDVMAAYANISGGSMTAPAYDTRATMVSLVVSGKGTVEMVCPHLSSSQGRQEGKEGEEEEEQEGEKGQRGQRYQRVRANLSPGTVFVAPPGHPTVYMANQGENLEVVWFGIHAKKNQKMYLAGENSVLRQLEDEAKELAFDAPASEVKKVLKAQKSKGFLPGPNERQEKGKGEGRGRPLASIMDFAGF